MGLQHFRSKLFSGLKHFYAVHFGGVTVEVEVRPVGGGGGAWTPAGPVYIRVTVKYKDQIWTVQREHSYLGGIGLALVKATFIRFEVIKALVSANLNRINTIIERIIVRANKK